MGTRKCQRCRTERRTARQWIVNAFHSDTIQTEPILSYRKESECDRDVCESWTRRSEDRAGKFRPHSATNQSPRRRVGHVSTPRRCGPDERSSTVSLRRPRLNIKSDYSRPTKSTLINLVQLPLNTPSRSISLPWSRFDSTTRSSSPT